MMLVDRAVSDFSEILASGEPTPGGGSTAALEGALGAALIGMVASLTVGRKKHGEYERLMTESIRNAEALRIRLMDIIDRDAEAFNDVAAIFAMPSETDEEKASRSSAMQSALKSCVIPPLETMECALSALELAGEMLGKSNSNAASDLGVAALSLRAAVCGAWLNVLINLGGISDEIFVARYRERGEAILKLALPLADRIHSDILEGLCP